MTTNSWVGPAGIQSFGTEGSSDTNWSQGHVPTSSEDAVIDTGANGAIIGASSNEDVGSIALGSNDALSINSFAQFQAENGTGPNVNHGTIDVAGSCAMYVGNGAGTVTFNNAGVIDLAPTSTDRFSTLWISGSVNLTGSGVIEMSIDGPQAESFISASSPSPSTLTNFETISGKGEIGADLNVINEGTVETNNSTSTSGGTLLIDGSSENGSFTNNGDVIANDGGTLIFGHDRGGASIVNNFPGEVAIEGNTKTTKLEIAGDVTITSASSGIIDLAGSTFTDNQIVSDGQPATLNLVNQTLKGSGTVGDANLTLDNVSGSILTNAQSQLLVLNTGGNTIVNGAAGSLVAERGELEFFSAVSNSGTIAANGGELSVQAPISGSGAVDIGQGGILITNATIAGNVTFTGAGELLIEDNDANGGIGGNLVGAASGDAVVFSNISFAPGMQAVWQQNGGGGTLSLVSNGATLATLNLAGQYTAADFSAVSYNQGTGTQIDIANPNPPSGTTGDMVMRNGNNGDYEIYDLGNNAIQAAYALGQVGTEWQVAGIGGFDGTDTSDMILRATSGADAGDFELYDISNNNIASAALLGQVGLEWSVAGFGDFSSRSGETDMLMRDSNTGQFEIYDLANNGITFAAPMGQVGLEWSVAGFGDFSTRPNETDMLMRNSNTGAFELYDISNNAITSAGPMGQVGLEWSVAGVGDFSGNANETDMLMRNRNTGAFEIYDISNNTITSAAPMGQVGLEWSVVGFGPISGAGASDMLMRNNNTGAFEVYDITNNQITSAGPMGQVGLEWSVAGIAADPPGSANAQLAQGMASFAPARGGFATAPLVEATAPSSPVLLAAQVPQANLL